MLKFPRMHTKKVLVKKRRVVLKKGAWYPVILHPEVQDGFWVECPIFDGCYSQGKTMEEALEHIKEAIAMCAEEVAKPDPRAAEVSVHMVRV